MQPQAPASPRHRSPFVAAFLSFLFPGLGQAYAGFLMRGLALAAPMVLLVALLAGLLATRRPATGCSRSSSSPTSWSWCWSPTCCCCLPPLAIVDAFRLAAFVAGTARAPAGASRGPAAAVGPLGLRWACWPCCVVTPLLHVGVARYDLLAYDVLTGITGGQGDDGTDALRFGLVRQRGRQLHGPVERHPGGSARPHRYHNGPARSASTSCSWASTSGPATPPSTPTR